MPAQNEDPRRWVSTCSLVHDPHSSHTSSPCHLALAHCWCAAAQSCCSWGHYEMYNACTIVWPYAMNYNVPQQQMAIPQNCQEQWATSGPQTNGSNVSKLLCKPGGNVDVPRGKGLHIAQRRQRASRTHNRRAKSPVSESASCQESYCNAQCNGNTTLMVRNIPNKYTRTQLILELQPLAGNEMDFLYLPVDFRSWANLGYCFVNFKSDLAACQFSKVFTGRTWERFASKKRCEIVAADIQGFNELVAHFASSAILKREERAQPVVFAEGGGPILMSTFLISLQESPFVSTMGNRATAHSTTEPPSIRAAPLRQVQPRRRRERTKASDHRA
jgi:hypothetical protein